MDLGGKDDYELENRTENSVNCSPSMSSGWRFGGAQLLKTSMGLVNPANSSGKEGLIFPSCSSASMVDSFGPNFNGGFFDLYSNVSSSNPVGISRDSAGSMRKTSDRSLDMSWNPPNQTRGSNLPGFAHPSLPQFPADSAFIERAARLSCFNGGNLMEIASPFGIPQSMPLYSWSSGTNPSNQEINSIDGMRLATAGQPQKQEISDIGEASMDVCLEHGSENPENDGKNENLLRSHNEEKRTISGSGSESEDEMSGGAQDEPSTAVGREEEPSGKGIGPKKRKRVRQNTGLDQAKDGESAKDDKEIEQKDDQNPYPVANKSTGKHSKQGSQPSDPPKEEYIHVRARRGQATNSHSLAERVRREKISERMKFLQDLVPGCSKVTGKAVMLDEIINYVQSLQRQVEFLSMKLATVNPRMDFNIDGLAKDILQARAGSSSSLGYSPDISMAYPPLQPSQHGLLSSGVHCLGSSSQILRRTLSSHLTTPMTGGFKEPSQLPNVWEVDELHHVFQMSYAAAAASNSQSVDGSLPPADMKVEH